MKNVIFIIVAFLAGLSGGFVLNNLTEKKVQCPDVICPPVCPDNVAVNLTDLRNLDKIKKGNLTIENKIEGDVSIFQGCQADSGATKRAILPFVNDSLSF